MKLKQIFSITFGVVMLMVMIHGTELLVNATEGVKTYTVTYHANNGTDQTDSRSAEEGINITLANDIFTYGKCEIESWNTQADGSGDIYEIDEEVNEDLTLYAQWVLPLHKLESFTNEDFEWSGNDSAPYSFSMKNDAVFYGRVIFPVNTNDDKVTVIVDGNCEIKGSISFVSGTGYFGSNYRGNTTIQGDGTLTFHEMISTGVGDTLTVLTDVTIVSDYMFIGASGGMDSKIVIKDAVLTLHDLTLLQFLTMEGTSKLNIATGTASFCRFPEINLSEQSEIYIGGDGYNCVLYSEGDANDAFDALISDGWLPEGYSFKEENYGYYLYDAEDILETDAIIIKKQLEPSLAETPSPTPTETEVPQPTATPEETKPFTDVNEDWYTPYIRYVFENNLMNGIEGTTLFDPNGNITKAQVAQVLYNMEGRPEVTDTKVFEELSDVYKAEWYADAAAWAYSTGVITGDLVEMKFFGNDDATREQLALMLYRYARFKAYDLSATSDFAGLLNADKVAEWSMHGVKWAVGAGMITGIETEAGHDLAPQGTATRGQMAAILQRFCEYYEK